MSILSENMAALQGVLGAQNRGFTESRARAMTPIQEAMEIQRFKQNQMLNQLKLQQMQNLAPIEQQLKQLQMERERQALSLGEQKQEAAQFEIAEAKGQRLMSLATSALQKFDSDPELAQAIMAGGAQRYGLDIGNVEDITKDQLKSFIEQNRIASTKLDIKSSRIFNDGTMISQTSKGPVVFDPTGRQLSGKAADEQIKQANQFETALQRSRTLGRESAQQSIDLSGQAFEQLPLIRKNIGNLDDAIRLIGEGAATGTIMSRLPSVKQASIELDILQAQLGLDVIGSTTFGALSGDELKFALSTALPTKLKGPELTKWLEKKRSSQTKLAEYIQDAAIYLGRGGTVADFIELQKNIQKSGIAPEERRFEEPVESEEEVQRASIGTGRKARRDRGQQPQQELSIEALVDQYAD